MELKEVIGRRRSIRFFEPWRDVEREKIQAILEAIYRAPRVLEVDFIRIVVLHRDRLTPEQMAQLKTPTTTAQLDMAPVYVFFFADMDALEEAARTGGGFNQLVDAGVLNRSHGWTPEFVKSTAAAYLKALADDPDRVPMGPPGPDGKPRLASREALRLARTAIGIAQDYALLAAFNEGLGALLSAVSVPAAKAVMGIPDSWAPSSPMLLGYPGETPEAGGQRPREPFEEDFFELHHGHPFYREPAVVERLKAAGMIQEEAPFPWRMDEVRGLARKYGLPD